MKPWLKILVGLFIGVIIGLSLNQWGGISTGFGRTTSYFLSLVGKAFIDLLKMLVGLIVFSSLVVGMCHIHDPKKLGRIGIRTLLFYATSTILAIGIGLLVVYLIQPGKGLLLTPADLTSKEPLRLLDFIFSLVPSNPFASFSEGNILQIIVFAILFAFAIILCGKHGKPVLNFIESLSEVMHRLTQIVMKFAPYGVCALIANTIAMIGSHAIVRLFWAVVCIFLACILQVSVVFALAIRRLAKLTVMPFFKGMKDAIVVAFTTSSSSATLPVSIECATNHLGISSDIAGFVLSLGSTVNMNGTAIGQAVLSIFIAQAYGIEINLVAILILTFTTLISAVGTAGIPGSGLVMLSIVLSAMGLPLEGIALVAGIDRFRDMFGTVVNILGDAVAAVYVGKKEGQIDEEQYQHVTWTT